MEQLKGLLILYCAILAFNLVFDAILWRGDSNGYYRTLFWAWMGGFLSFSLNGLASTSPFIYRVYASSTLFVSYAMFAHLLSSILGMQMRWKPYAILHVGGLVATFALYEMGARTPVYAFPALTTAALPSIYVAGRALLSRNRRFSTSSFFFTLFTLLSALHAWDFFYFVDKSDDPRYAFFGFTIGVILAMAITTFSTAAAIEALTAENTRVRTEAEQGAKMASSARLASLGEVAGGVAHEINNPLAIVQLNAEKLIQTMGDQTPDIKAAQRSAAVISTTVNRIAKVTQGLLDFSRDSAKDPIVSASMAECVRKTLTFCEERFQQGQVEVIQGAMPEIKARCRPNQVSQAVFNLLNNAFDAVSGMANGGKKWIKVEILESGGQVRLEISDSGGGLSPDAKKRLFQPFYTTKELGKGMGLGLSSAKGLIEANHGNLALDDRAQHTTFVVSLPKAA